MGSGSQKKLFGILTEKIMKVNGNCIVNIVLFFMMIGNSIEIYRIPYLISFSQRVSRYMTEENMTDMHTRI